MMRATKSPPRFAGASLKLGTHRVFPDLGGKIPPRVLRGPH